MSKGVKAGNRREVMGPMEHGHVSKARNTKLAALVELDAEDLLTGEHQISY